MLKSRMHEQLEAIERSFSDSNADGFTMDFPNTENGETEKIWSHSVYFKPYVQKAALH